VTSVIPTGRLVRQAAPCRFLGIALSCAMGMSADIVAVA
jgi:hypothetical protein